MVAAPTTHVMTVTMTLWEHDEPVGECRLDARHQLMVRALDPARQRNLQRWVRTKYQMHAKIAREDGRELDAAHFLEGLPRYLHGSLRYATRPSLASDIPMPTYITVPPLDLSQVTLTPRRTVRRQLTP